MTKNIIFDMGNVLVTYAPQIYIKTIIEDEAMAAVVLKELFHENEWRQLDAGTILEEKAVEQVIQRIPQYAEYVQKAMDHWHTSLKPIKGMTEIVKSLKDKNYNIYLLSNVSLRFFDIKDQFEILKYFDGFVISAQEKLVKPDKEIYDCICTRFELKCEECLFIDDLQHNIDGAINAGIQGHLFVGVEELSEYLEKQNIL